jgi:hypothetical protein
MNDGRYYTLSCCVLKGFEPVFKKLTRKFCSVRIPIVDSNEIA